ncbi:MAG TPA: hypothetical protein VJ696_11690 [Rhodanobacteraceae bacterium]|nr:hypothetical protein [Rhodanobacteraceae bacterium]
MSRTRVVDGPVRQRAPEQHDRDALDFANEIRDPAVARIGGVGAASRNRVEIVEDQDESPSTVLPDVAPDVIDEVLRDASTMIALGHAVERFEFGHGPEQPATGILFVGSSHELCDRAAGDVESELDRRGRAFGKTEQLCASRIDERPVRRSSIPPARDGVVEARECEQSQLLDVDRRLNLVGIELAPAVEIRPQYDEIVDVERLLGELDPAPCDVRSLRAREMLAQLMGEPGLASTAFATQAQDARRRRGIVPQECVDTIDHVATRHAMSRVVCVVEHIGQPVRLRRAPVRCRSRVRHGFPPLARSYLPRMRDARARSDTLARLS